MIHIIGDTADELSDLQKILETGILNSTGGYTGILNSTGGGTIDVTYKLSYGGILLVDQYNHIVGEKELPGLDDESVTTTFQKTESYEMNKTMKTTT